MENSSEAQTGVLVSLVGPGGHFRLSIPLNFDLSLAWSFIFQYSDGAAFLFLVNVNKWHMLLGCFCVLEDLGTS